MKAYELATNNQTITNANIVSQVTEFMGHNPYIATTARFNKNHVKYLLRRKGKRSGRVLHRVVQYLKEKPYHKIKDLLNDIKVVMMKKGMRVFLLDIVVVAVVVMGEYVNIKKKFMKILAFVYVVTMLYFSIVFPIVDRLKIFYILFLGMVLI
ncbi:hypothetical protein BDA99DRAFT_540162 [Phascolomyces articulosus]|uniref:Uncharacterized protein n=1 Tax=Phascolomyces articulosus TaxID=60185 RepID=A0AAD5K5F4_9FUNG|nr:hypothetical protein BDA99DRAFT_540162 [Phascolomyces articulosus]